MTSDLFFSIIDVYARFMTSDSIEAIPLHRLVTSNDVDMGLKSGQPALGKMDSPVNFKLAFLDFWQAES